jgi:hypothetical protein
MLVLRVQGLRLRVSDVLMRFDSWCEGAVCVRERVRGSPHMLHTREKQTRRFAALSEHQHASMRLGVQCMNALILCVWPDHAFLSLWARGLPPPQTPPPPRGMPAAVCLKEALCARRKTHSCAAEPSSSVCMINTHTHIDTHTHTSLTSPAAGA